MSIQQFIKGIIYQSVYHILLNNISTENYKMLSYTFRLFWTVPKKLASRSTFFIVFIRHKFVKLVQVGETG